MTLPNEPDRAAEAASGASTYAAPADDGGADEGAKVAELQTALAAAEAKAAEHRDLYMRALAEIDNVRKRSVRDLEQAHKFAIEKFAAELVNVKDSLELGLATEGSVESIRAGAEATLKLLARAFEKAGVVEIAPQGETFNPELHEAMAAQPSAEHVPNTVLQVIQKGYSLNSRLLRPARVIVAREP